MSDDDDGEALLEQLALARQEREELREELAISRRREADASSSAEQSYMLVSEVQAKVREQMEAITSDHQKQSASAVQEAADAREQLLKASQRFEERMTGMQEDADAKLGRLNFELQQSEQLAAAADTDALDELQQALTKAAAEAEDARMEAQAAKSRAADMEAETAAQCSEEIKHIQAMAQAELLELRETEAQIKSSADDRVAIAMSSAMMADQGRIDQEMRAEERVREVREAARASTAAQVDAAVREWKEKVAQAQRALEIYQDTARNEVAEAQMQQLERAAALEKQSGLAMERAAAAEGRISELLLQSAGDIETVASLRRKVAQCENRLRILEPDAAAVVSEVDAVIGGGVGMLDGVVTELGGYLEGVFDSGLGSTAATPPTMPSSPLPSSMLPPQPIPSAEPLLSYAAKETDVSMSMLVSGTAASAVAATAAAKVGTSGFVGEASEAGSDGDGKGGGDNDYNYDGGSLSSVDMRAYPQDKCDTDAARMAGFTNDHIYRAMREDMRCYRQRCAAAGIEPTLERWSAESEWARDTGGEAGLARAQVGKWRELFEEVSLEDAMRDSLQEAEAGGAPSLVIQLHASKQLAQQQCQLLVHQNAELKEISRALRDRSEQLETKLREADDEIARFKAREEELSHSKESIVADLREKTAEALAGTTVCGY